MKLNLNQHIINTIERNKMVVLRDKNGVALNASFSEEGLRWTTNKNGKKLFFKKGNYVEPFKPRISKDRFQTMAEMTWIEKAYRLSTY